MLIMRKLRTFCFLNDTNMFVRNCVTHCCISLFKKWGTYVCTNLYHRMMFVSEILYQFVSEILYQFFSEMIQIRLCPTMFHLRNDTNKYVSNRITQWCINLFQKWYKFVSIKLHQFVSEMLQIHLDQIV